MAQVFDTLFGTRYYTEGATLQLPRKVPMRVEPKSYFGGCLLGASPPGRVILPRGTRAHPTTTPTPTHAHAASRPAANERTFLSWCGMATTMGGVSSAMVGLSASSSAGGADGRLISKKTVRPRPRQPPPPPSNSPSPPPGPGRGMQPARRHSHSVTVCTVPEPGRRVASRPC